MVTKICKKHGELKEKDTYSVTSKQGTLITLCSICKKGYRNDWAKLNPDKVKLSQIKKREKRLEELKKGTLKKNCKVHGDLPIEKIRVDARGTRICRICSNEQAYKSHKNNPNYKENQKKWYHSDIDRKKRYAENDKPKRRIRQRRYYHELKITDPEKHQYLESIRRKAARRASKNLDDSYVKRLLKTIRSGGKKNRQYQFLSGIEIPQEIVEIKKLQIKLNRELRKQRKKNGN